MYLVFLFWVTYRNDDSYSPFVGILHKNKVNNDMEGWRYSYNDYALLWSGIYGSRDKKRVSGYHE